MQVLDTGFRGEGGVREDAKEVEGPPLCAGRDQEHPTGGQTAFSELCTHHMLPPSTGHTTHKSISELGMEPNSTKWTLARHYKEYKSTVGVGAVLYLGSKLRAANLWSCL